MTKRKKIFRKALIMVMVLLTIIINSVTVKAADDLYCAVISEDFLIEIKNPYGEEREVVFEVEYYDEDEKIYSERIERTFQGLETRVFDAKEFFDSPKISQVEVKFINIESENFLNIMGIGIIILFVILCGFVSMVVLFG